MAHMTQPGPDSESGTHNTARSHITQPEAGPWAVVDEIEVTPERIWHTQHSQAQILAVALRWKSLKRFQLFRLRSEADERRVRAGSS